MKNKTCCLIILIFSFYMGVSALGVHEQSEVQALNDEWVLCITDFDASSLPDNKNNIAGVIMRRFVESFSAISFRNRQAVELSYYEETAWTGQRAEAARAIAAKQNERSMLVFRGDPEWIYIRNVQRIDSDLEKLFLALDEIDRNAPVIENLPVFGMTKENTEYMFPSAPPEGGEYGFCLNHNCDAVLTGEIIEFYERILITVRLYAVYAQSYIWEDSIIFSPEDLESAVEEFTRGLIIAISGNAPSILTVKAEPDDTLLLINRTFAGRGETSGIEYPPGTITINASAPNHENLTFTTELFSGNHTEIGIKLTPIEYVNAEITGNTEGSIYHGALYAGESPVTLRLPVNQLEYFQFETSENERSTVVFYPYSGINTNRSLIMPDAVPPAAGIIDKARREFYWAFGSTLITGIAAWLSYYTYVNSNAAISYNYADRGSYNQNFYDYNRGMYYVSMGTLIAVGVSVAIDIFFVTRYIKAANRSNTPVFRTGR